MGNIKDLLLSGDNDKISEVLIDLSDEDLKDQEIIEILFDIYKNNKNEFIRERIFEIFKRINNDWINNKLVELFSSDDPYLRNSAIEILQTKDDSILDLLYKKLDSDDKDIRKLVIDTAAGFDKDKIIDIFKKALNDKDINVVIAAVEYIGNIKIEELGENIFNIFIKSDNPMLKVVSLEALSKIGKACCIDDIKEYFRKNGIDELYLFPYLKLISSVGDFKDILDLLDFLDINNQSYVNELVNAIENIIERKQIKELPEEVFDLLTRFYQSDIQSINKYEILELLVNYGDKKTKEYVKEALNSDDKILIMGALEIIMEKEMESEFLKEIKEVQLKYKNDEDIQDILSDLLYFSGEN